jgi:hypothetical protein
LRLMLFPFLLILRFLGIREFAFLVLLVLVHINENWLPKGSQ